MYVLDKIAKKVLKQKKQTSPSSFTYSIKSRYGNSAKANNLEYLDKINQKGHFWFKQKQKTTKKTQRRSPLSSTYSS